MQLHREHSIRENIGHGIEMGVKYTSQERKKEDARTQKQDCQDENKRHTNVFMMAKKGNQYIRKYTMFSGNSFDGI